MRERVLENFSLKTASEQAVVLENSHGYQLSVNIVDAERVVYRVRVTGPDRPLPVNSFFKRYHDGSEARQLANGGSADTSKTSATLKCGDTEATLSWKVSSPSLCIKDTKTGQVLHEDLAYRGYNLSANGIRHYSCLNRKDVHFGLGEAAAPLDRTGRKFEVRTSDSANYNPWRTDPLYKHTPFLITVPHEGGKCTAYYSTSHADSIWDVGCSIDEPWGAYKAFEVETGALDEYIWFGDLQETVQTLAAFTGALPLMPPRWALGYISSPMGLAEIDEPPCQESMEQFLLNLQKHDVPSSAIQLASGYTVTGGARNVFTLNTHRFPDMPGFCKKAHELGMRVVPNIKPYVNVHHPDYNRLAKGNGLFHDPFNKEHVKTYIWSLGIGDKLAGGWCDTSSVEGFKWWYEGASQLIKMGLDGMWNDNDEYSLHDDEYEAAWDLPGLPAQDGKRKKVGLVGRTYFTELLGKASYQALLDHSPGRRPYILTRSANLNTMQYVASTWSGDNNSSWAAMKGNCAVTIGSSMCLYHSYGNDVGGFAGPLPEPELWVRWCQISAYHTRFCVNSIHTNPNDPDRFSVNSPWMHTEVIPLIREAIKRRYELIPFMYSLHHEGRLQKSPPVAFLGWGAFQQDKNIFTREVLDSADFWLGAGRLLIAGVFEPGLKSRKVYLPKAGADDKEVYFQLFKPYKAFSAGSTIEVETGLDFLPVFARSGSVIPIGKRCATITADITKTTNDGTEVKITPGFVELDDFRGVELFPRIGSQETYTGEWIEDDGESTWPCPIARIRVEYSNAGDEVQVKATWQEKSFKPIWKSLHVLLPVGDERKVTGAKASKQHHDGRTLFEIEVQQG